MISSRLSLLLALPLALVVGIEAFSSGEPPALWVAQSQGIVKLVDGAVALQIPSAADVQAVAVDGKHERVWAYAAKRLSSYDFDGHPLTATTIDPPAGNPTLLAVDARADRVWLAVQTQLQLFDGLGQMQWQTRLPNPIAGMTVDAKRSLLWVAHKGTLEVYDASGERLAAIADPDVRAVQALDYDASRDEVWVAADDRVLRYGANGVATFSASLQDLARPTAIAAGQDGGLWLTDSRQVAHMSGEGVIEFGVAPSLDGGGSSVVSLAADAREHGAWIATQRRVIRYAADGTLVGEYVLSDDPSHLIRQVALPAGPIAPQIEFTAPASGSALNTSRPTFTVQYSGEDVDLESLAFTADAAVLATSCAAQAEMAACTADEPLADGPRDIAATIADASGNVSDPALLRITIDTVAPAITVTSPANGALTNVASGRIEGTLSEPAALTLDDAPVAVTERRFSQAVTLSEGLNSFALRAVDEAGNAGTSSVSVRLDTVPPPAPVAGSIAARASSGQLTVSGAAGSVEGGSLVTLVNTRTGERVTVTANADGSFSATLAGEAGDALQVYATDGATNQGGATTVTAVGGPFSGAIAIDASSPAGGETVDGDRLLVTVDLTAPPNTGVTVNDVVAVPVGTASAATLRFYAEVPLATGANTLNVKAHGQDGRVVTRTINVTSRGPFPYRVVADRSAGVAPLKPRLEVWDQSGRGIRQVQVDADANGSIDVVANPGDPIELSYSGVGARQARVIVFDNALTPHEQRVTFVLLDPATVDRSIQAVWGAMNEALAQGDKAAAMSYLSEQARETYEPVFDALMPRMGEIVASYSGLKRSLVTTTYAEYGVNRVVNGQNKIFLTGFVANVLGQWQLEAM